jgi:HSP20 family protein
VVMRFDPFQDIDRLAEQLRGREQRVRSFPLDAYRRGEEFFLHFDLPGVAPDEIEVTSEQNVLTVKAERRYERQENDEVIVNERPEGVFARQVFLGESLDLEQIDASYEQGVLTLRIPVKQAARPRRIEISGQSSGPQEVETESRG